VIEVAAILFVMQRSTRWTAGILLLVMVASAFVPMALARSVQSNMQSGGMRCERRKKAARDEMACHGAMAEALTSDTSSDETDGPYFQSTSECCGNHDCCCRIGSSEGERFLPASPSIFALVFHRPVPSQNSLLALGVALDQDSARAPPV
jgi:hypothetical protein